MATFNEILTNVNVMQDDHNKDVIADLVVRYPFFELAKYIAVRCDIMPMSEIGEMLPSRPYPAILLPERQSNKEFSFKPSVPLMSTQTADNEDLCAPYLETDDSLISETYATILASQGEKERAKEIYMQLSLKNPEKSSYFAFLIGQLQ